MAIASAMRPLVTLVYSCVDEISEWPRISCTCRRSAPRSSSSVRDGVTKPVRQHPHLHRVVGELVHPTANRGVAHDPRRRSIRWEDELATAVGVVSATQWREHRRVEVQHTVFGPRRFDPFPSMRHDAGSRGRSTPTAPCAVPRSDTPCSTTSDRRPRARRRAHAPRRSGRGTQPSRPAEGDGAASATSGSRTPAHRDDSPPAAKVRRQRVASLVARLDGVLGEGRPPGVELIKRRVDELDVVHAPATKISARRASATYIRRVFGAYCSCTIHRSNTITDKPPSLEARSERARRPSRTSREAPSSTNRSCLT